MELGPMLGFLMVSFCLSEQLGPPYDLNSDLAVAPAAPLCEMTSSLPPPRPRSALRRPSLPQWQPDGPLSQSSTCRSAPSCLTLCDPMDCSPPGSSVHGILQARVLEGVAMPSSRGIFLTQGSNLHPLTLLYCRRILYH